MPNLLYRDSWLEIAYRDYTRNRLQRLGLESRTEIGIKIAACGRARNLSPGLSWSRVLRYRDWTRDRSQKLGSEFLAETEVRFVSKDAPKSIHPPVESLTGSGADRSTGIRLEIAYPAWTWTMEIGQFKTHLLFLYIAKSVPDIPLSV